MKMLMLNCAFYIVGGIKKELAVAKKKVEKLNVSILDNDVPSVCFLCKHVIFFLKCLQIADRRDQEKKAYGRMFH